MMLPLLILIPLAGGCLAALLARKSPAACRWVTLLSLAADGVLALGLCLRPPLASAAGAAGAVGGRWIEEFRLEWIPQIGSSIHLAADGLSLPMVVLTAFIGIIAVAISWHEIQERVGFFHFNIAWVLAGVVGVFFALDLVLFYFFWELMLIPMYFLIGIWGHENRIYAAIKFFIFTQASGLLMLLAILGLYFVHGKATGEYTFDYERLLGTTFQGSTGMWLMLGFLIAFAVKLPAVPFHTWLPDAHTEAPTAGSVILAGLLLKTGAYGILRFVGPLFPQAAREFAPLAMWVGAAGVVYGAVLAFAQSDLKRLVAYTSVSHLGFVLLGAFAWNEVALQGVLLQMICHGISTGALFILAGGLYERIHTRDLGVLGGLWAVAPRMGAMGLLFAMASLGLPGLGNFVGEFLVLLGAFKVGLWPTAVAAAGLVAATIYSLALFDRTFHGPNRRSWSFKDLDARETAVFAALVAGIVWLGLYPQPVLDLAKPAITRILGIVGGSG